MGFWDAVSSVAKGAVNAVNEYNAEMQALKSRMQDKSSNELRSIVKNEGFFSSSEKEKKIAYLVLKERGEV